MVPRLLSLQGQTQYHLSRFPLGIQHYTFHAIPSRGKNASLEKYQDKYLKIESTLILKQNEKFLLLKQKAWRVNTVD